MLFCNRNKSQKIIITLKKKKKVKEKKQGSGVGSTLGVKPTSGAIIYWLSLHLSKPQVLYLSRSL